MKERKTSTNWKSEVCVVAACLLLFLGSCGEREGKQQNGTNTERGADTRSKDPTAIASISFQDETGGNIFADYQEIRMALTNDNSNKAKAAAENLVDNFPASQQETNSTVLAMASTDDIKVQRQLFSELTEKLEPVLRASLSGGTIYKQFCPMAFDGKGGYWLSVSEEIRNPYFGEKMLKCGTVKETIRK